MADGAASASVPSPTDRVAVRINAPDRVGDRPVIWSPLPGFQTRFCASPAFETLGGGAAGPGKTSCIVALAAGDAQHPSARVLVLRTVYREMQDIRDRMDALYPQLGAKWEATDARWRFPQGGLVALGHGATQSELGPFLGPEYTSVNWDEISLLAREELWQMALSRVRSPDPTVRLVARATANPVGPGKPWLTTRFIEKCGGELGGKIFRDSSGRTRTYIPGTSKDNKYLPASYWEGLSDLPPSLQAALRDGLWTSELGLFYPELSDANNLARLFISRAQVPALLDRYEYWSSLDWGFVHPLAHAQFVRIKSTVYWLDTMYLHRYQDEEQAATIRGSADARTLRMCYAGHDAFAKRMAHSAAAETVADVYARYGILLERANIDRAAGAKTLRRFIAPPKPGPVARGSVTLVIVDTPGNRRAVAELAALIPEETNPNVPSKRDANESGQHGDDGADCGRYGLATPTFEPEEPVTSPVVSNVSDGVDHDFDMLMSQVNGSGFQLTTNGARDRREYVQPTGPMSDSDMQIFPGDL